MSDDPEIISVWRGDRWSHSYQRYMWRYTDDGSGHLTAYATCMETVICDSHRELRASLAADAARFNRPYAIPPFLMSEPAPYREPPKPSPTIEQLTARLVSLGARIDAARARHA